MAVNLRTMVFLIAGDLSSWALRPSLPIALFFSRLMDSAVSSCVKSPDVSRKENRLGFKLYGANESINYSAMYVLMVGASLRTPFSEVGLNLTIKLPFCFNLVKLKTIAKKLFGRRHRTDSMIASLVALDAWYRALMNRPGILSRHLNRTPSRFDLDG